MSDKQHLPDTVRSQAIDYVSSGAKAILGAVPFAGSLLAEIAGSIIPRQRVDRIADFAAKLEARIENLEKDNVRAQLNNEEFTDLVEETMRQAARSTSDERRSYLASLLAQSISSEAITNAESKHLLSLLGELNDVEVLWLRNFHVPTLGGDVEFRELHSGIFEPRIAHEGSSTQEFDEEAIQQSYHDHLLRLGLLRRHIKTNRDSTPEFDAYTGDFKVSYLEASQLGRLLLRTIGMLQDDEWPR